MGVHNILKYKTFFTRFWRIFDSHRNLVVLSATSMCERIVFNWVKCGLSLSLILLLLTLAPFAVAQDVHHELAAADTDGHEHSDTDLCQWVQHHTSGSLDLGDVVSSAFEIVASYECPAPFRLFSVEFSVVGPTRAPPRI